jgi:GT2 family glycosyltransferase
MNNFDKKVFAVIATWNGAAWISEAILSLQKSSVSINIVIVDNASTDETLAIVTKAFQNILLIRLNENLGFAQANNTGIQHALSHGADYVLLLNQDAKIQADTLGHLLEASAQHPDFGILSPIHVAYDKPEIAPSFFSFINNNVVFMSDILLNRLKEIYEVEYCNAAIWLLTRTVIEKTGGFDPIFFMYGEDNDYCYRARMHGYKVGIIPKAVAYHQCRSVDLSTMSLKKQYCKLSSQLVYLLKRPDHNFFLSCTGVLIAWLKRMIVEIINLEMRGFFASTASLISVFFHLGNIYRHYCQCKKPGKSWL